MLNTRPSMIELTRNLIVSTPYHAAYSWSIFLTFVMFFAPEQVQAITVTLDSSPFIMEQTPLPDRTIQGKITATNGEPIIGATIRIKDTNQGTVSDIDGSFTLTITDESQVLLVTYIGYLPLEVEIGSQTELNLVMEENIQELSEVVIVGYGRQENNRVSAAVQQVSAEELDIDKRPISTIESGLVGSVPGLILSQNSGQLGANVGIQIRSVGTLNNNAALILVDGIETSLQNINPNDIQSVTILKDASATAIYGARGG